MSEKETAREWEETLNSTETELLMALENVKRLEKKLFGERDDRTYRLAISNLRRYIPIVNLQDGQGYFIPTDEEAKEAERYFRQEYRRAMSILSRLKPLRQWLETRGQIEIEETERWEN